MRMRCALKGTMIRDRVGQNEATLKAPYEYANDGDAHCLTSRFHARVKCSALNHGIRNRSSRPKRSFEYRRRYAARDKFPGDFVSCAEI